jgi:hypothetical protein
LLFGESLGSTPQACGELGGKPKACGGFLRKQLPELYDDAAGK